MTTIPKENPTFNTLWAAWSHFEPEIQKDIYYQVIDGLSSLPLLGVVEHLSGLPDRYKKHAWDVWVERADLSGYSLQEIVATQDTEPYHCVYQIIKFWLHQVDLSKYSLAQVNKTNAALRTKEDIITLWSRWVEQADLSHIGLEALIKQMRDLSPDIQAIILSAYKQRSGNWGTRYTLSEIADIGRKSSLPKYVVEMVSGYSNAEREVQPKFKADDRVYCYPLGGGIQVIHSVHKNDGAWWYWLVGGDKYYRDTDLRLV
jgi:hypothetical protein